MIERDFNPIDPSALDERIRVLVVAPHPIQRTHLIHMILAHQDLDVVGVAANRQKVMRLCPHVRPDVVVVDPWDADMDGDALTSLLRSCWPWVQVLILSDTADSSDGSRGWNMGATIRALYAQRSGAPQWNRTGPQLRAFPDQALSRREWEVWQALKLGLSDVQIGEKLAVNELTARLYVRNVLDHLGLSSRQDVTLADRSDRIAERRAKERESVPERWDLAFGLPPAHISSSRHVTGLQGAPARYS